MPKNAKKPQIRFKGFTDAWEQRKLGEFGKATSGTSIEAEFLHEGKYKVINIGSYSEISQYIDQGIRVNKTEKIMNRILNKDDLTMILNDKTSKGNIIGRVLLIDADDTYVYNQRTERIEVYKDLFEPNFIYQLLNAENIRKKIISSAQGNTQIYINWSIISNFNYFVPLTKSEQKHLANFFDYFDNLITLHQRKLDKLKNIKKSMLEKMFPKNGSNIPEIRFKGFTDAWEQRKLGEVALSFEYGLNVAAKEYDGVNKYLRITDIDDESHNFKNNELTSPDIDLTNAYNFRLHEGDILFSRTGASVGKTFIYKKSDGIVYFAGFLIRARIKSEYDAEFIFQNTLCSKYEKYIKITSQRSGQPGVNAQEYAEYSFLIPKYKEQKQIGKYFYYLDNLITLHQRKLEKLQNIKKACLEKMFV
jgi:type I restriction enzyme S subunit